MTTPAKSQQQGSWKEYVEDFRQAGHEAVDWIAQYLERLSDHQVLAKVKPGELFDSLPRSAPEHGESFETILRDFDKVIMPAVTQWNHPRFFAYFACTGSTPAILGEMLAAALNTNGLHWKTSPAIAELEQVTLDWLRQWMGLAEDWFGIVYDTASTSSMHAIACAREMVAPEARVDGSTPNLTLYTSEQSHSSIEKDAIATGIGQSNVRKVPVDAEFRMRPDALAAMVQQDVAAGKRPFCVVATVGTTSSTSIDPVPQIADIAEKHGMWLHVDAAYAGVAAILPECRSILNGAERAHSLVVNAHKWLLTPIDLSAFYTRRPDILRRAFSLVPEYLHVQDDPRAHNLMDYGVPLGHRFRALKFWYVLRYFGLERIQAMLRSHIQWAKEFAALVDAHPDFERVAPVPFSVVCFRYKGSDDDNKKILEEINATGRMFLSHTILNGRVVIRMAIGNLATTWEDVREAWAAIQAASKGNRQ
ncbi:MAG TPA: pyridoxal-dependent decarboxylase [Candidatus Angelobacter sp.]|nr:pyridoxal-dependent decarboxylase [Candidatus Angelobacter sp.]